jgi:hypothetical protein
VKARIVTTIVALGLAAAVAHANPPAKKPAAKAAVKPTKPVAPVPVSPSPADIDDTGDETATQTAAIEDSATSTPEPSDQPPGATMPSVTTPVEPTGDADALRLGFVERMPPSAFDSPRTRGIPGGSLAATFHGLQWPYYPKTGIAVSGYAWMDSGYEKINRGNPSEQSISYWLQQGRLLFRVTPTYTRGDYFVQGQAELVVNKDQSLRQPDIADTDDVWLKFGKWNSWDLQLGRYEGWEVYHFGMGLDLNTLERNGASDEAFSVPGIYGVTYAFYRPASVGQAALHWYPTDFLRFEAGTQFGNEFGSNALAVRPVAVLDLGLLKIKAGGEYKKLTDQHDGLRDETMSRGAGASVQIVIDPVVEAGVNGAYGLVDRVAQDGTIDEKGSNTTYSVGAFANARVVRNLVVGGGINYTYLEDTHFDPMLGRVDQFKHTQGFGAIQYVINGSLYLKAVVALANADFDPTFGDPIFRNAMWSSRFRVMYVF